MKDDLHFRDLRAFVAVAESESIVQAATKLRASQSAITRRLQSLEEALGVTLVHRDARPLRLTSDGREAYRYAKSILKTARNLRHVLDASADVRGVFRFGVSMSLADTMMAHPTECMRNEFPRLQLEAVSGESNDLASRAAKRELDAAFIVLQAGRQLEGELFGEELMTESLSVVMPRDAPGGDVMSLREVRPSWIVNPIGCPAREALVGAYQRLQLPLKIAFETSSAQLKLSLVESGIGVGIALPSVVRASPSRAGLKLVSSKEIQQPITYWLVHGPELGRLARPLSCFRSALKLQGA